MKTSFFKIIALVLWLPICFSCQSDKDKELEIANEHSLQVEVLDFSEALNALNKPENLMKYNRESKVQAVKLKMQSLVRPAEKLLKAANYSKSEISALKSKDHNTLVFEAFKVASQFNDKI